MHFPDVGTAVSGRGVTSSGMTAGFMQEVSHSPPDCPLRLSGVTRQFSETGCDPRQLQGLLLVPCLGPRPLVWAAPKFSWTGDQRPFFHSAVGGCLCRRNERPVSPSQRVWLAAGRCRLPWRFPQEAPQTWEPHPRPGPGSPSSPPWGGAHTGPPPRGRLLPRLWPPAPGPR